MQTVTPSSVWQRRTHRLIAAAVIVIGLTMMLSNITQCIYAGMTFIIISLSCLAYMTMKERKMVTPQRPEDQPSPVLFLVTSHMLPRINRPSVPNANDKPPTYDQILTLDGLPPEYSSVLLEKPPRYEDLSLQQEKSVSSLPSTSGIKFASQGSVSSKATTSGEAYSSNPATEHNNYSLEGSLKAEHKKVDSDLNNIVLGNKSVENTEVFISSYNRTDKKSSSLPRHAPPPVPVARTRKRNNSSNNIVRQDAAPVHHSAAKTTSLLRLQVPTLPQDIANSSMYLTSLQGEDLHEDESSRTSNTEDIAEPSLHHAMSAEPSSGNSEAQATVITITHSVVPESTQAASPASLEDPSIHSNAPL